MNTTGHRPPPNLQPAAPATKRPLPADLGGQSESPSGTGLPFSGAQSSFGRPPTSITTPPPPRSLSQPLIGHMQPFVPGGPPFPGTPQPRDILGGAQGMPGNTVSPGSSQDILFSSSGFPGGGPPGKFGRMGATPTELYRSLSLGVGVETSDGQTILRMQPGHDGEPLEIPVDRRLASKAADQKRHKNAIASQQHRQRKKEKEQTMEAQNRELEAERRELRMELQEMTRQRDYYRAERDRLRDLVLQTTLREQAAGPPSPPPIYPGPSRAERATSGQVTAPQASNEPTGERPTRRRRTGGAPPQFTTPDYGTPMATPANLPPMARQPYDGGQALAHPMQSAGDRLPPVRTVEGQPGPTGADGAFISRPGGPPMYTNYARVETGWASQPSGHAHPGQPAPIGYGAPQGLPPPGRPSPPSGPR
ncbi:hypothetical protein ACRALDRAFT_1065872 [Sodiomyces alcalophilus JCM 7366]|uniref:uncharacterized protein n=1 Tax=Sodiomyces alcalophilus JCM 7366 TaxID=591952 RepID=UPI0039B38675